MQRKINSSWEVKLVDRIRIIVVLFVVPKILSSVQPCNSLIVVHIMVHVQRSSSRVPSITMA